MTRPPGQVHLVGAGPGDPGLLTIRGLRLLRAAQVVVHDRLASTALLAHARYDAEIIDVGKARGDAQWPQEEINALIVDHARRGRTVVRLKGGDPLVFGRAVEELAACRQAGVACEIVPGVSSVTAAPAAANAALTRRGVARSFTVLTGETLAGDGPPDVAAVAAADTLVVLMGRTHLAQITQRLIAAGRSPHTPALCVERATLPGQRCVRAALATLAQEADRAGLRPPVVTIIGQAAELQTGSGKPGGALERRCVVVTRPAAAGRPLRRKLSAAGAFVIACPLIRIEYIDPLPELDQVLSRLREIDWIVLTSAHAAQALQRRLGACGLDARALASCRLAAIGPATARTLQRGGLRADLMPQTHTAAALSAELGRQIRGRAPRVLYPHSDLSSTELACELRAAGAAVIEVSAYRNRPMPPAPGCRAALAAGVDAVVFHSPSAVRSFCGAGLQAPGAMVACVGPRTANEARQAGLEVAVVASPHTDEGVIAGLHGFFSVEEGP